VIVRPDAVSSARSIACTSPDVASVTSTGAPSAAAIRTVSVLPSASFIWDASVRRQIRSYRRRWSPVRPVSCGVRKRSPAGRIASCASCALFTFEVYTRGLSGTYWAPNRSVTWARAAEMACPDSVTESVRI